MNTDGDRRAEEILARIEHTRGEMDQTLSAIEQRLSRERLLDQGLGYLRNSGAAEFAQNLGGAARQNPLPVALTAVGIAWLMALGREPARHEGDAAPRGEGFGEDAGNSIRQRLSSTRERISEKASSVAERASSVADTARRQMDRTRDGIDGLVEGHPFVLGAIGLAVGAALGAAVPRSEREAQMMGDASRRMTEKAKEAGGRQFDKAKGMLENAAEAARQPQYSPPPDRQDEMQPPPGNAGRAPSGDGAGGGT
jgi:ElaB/YqjD/DUF883 family membrane-anchored ribosome-binding protein